VHLSVLFNASLVYGFVSNDYCFDDNVSKLDMYCDISLLGSVSKLFHSVLLSVFEQWLTTNYSNKRDAGGQQEIIW